MRRIVQLGRPDRGSTTVFTVVFAFALIVCIGLVVDGGVKIRAVTAATNCAQEAARAAAQVVDLEAIRNGQRRGLKSPEAENAARSYLTNAPGCQATGGDVQILGPDRDRVEVTNVRITKSTVILGIVGITEVHGTGQAMAQLVTQ